jgi:hypothetical protein
MFIVAFSVKVEAVKVNHFSHTETTPAPPPAPPTNIGTLECKLHIFTNEIIFVILVSIQLDAFKIEGLTTNLTQLDAAQY